MKTDIITIGTEYLTGMVKETDSFYLAGRLAELDLELRNQIVVADDPEEIKTVLAYSFSHSDMAIVIGGAGYGKDPLYKDIFAQEFGAEPRFCETAYSHMKELADKRQLRVTDEEIRALAILPEHEQLLVNHEGLCCGYILAKDHKYLVILPGSSREIRSVFEDDVVGFIYKTVSLGEADYTIEMKAPEEGSGLNKEELTAKIGPLLENDNPEIRLINSGNGWQLKIHAVGPTKADAAVIAQIAASDCANRIGNGNIRNIKEG